MHGLNESRRIATRIGLSFILLLFLLAVTANAYTVVMRGGRRVEIPSRFVVTAATLTYEVSPGLQITFAMAAIDIPATEQANNEWPGSLLRRVQSELRESQAAPATDPTSRQARRTITNRDLEASLRRRQESELADESRRKALGLPSLEESRRQAAAESDLMRLELEQQVIADRESENYWRERATSLRTEMATLDAELAYLRARLDEGPVANGWTGGWSPTSFNTITRGVPFGNFGRRQFGNFGTSAGLPPGASQRPNIFVAPNSGPQINGRVGFGGGATRGQVFLNPGTFPPARPVGGARFPAFHSAVFGSTLPAYDYSNERSVLITQFNELGAARAGLNARWRELEDEARRAGASPGWLRP